jgi:hypothetical protein
MPPLVCILVCAGMAAGPPLPRDVLESPFGIVCPWAEVGASGMGAVWCRCGGGATSLGDWPGIQPSADVFAWGAADGEMGRYEADSLVPAPILSYTPDWASRAPGTTDPRSRPPVDLWDYYRFCREISRRYAGRVWFWEIWNEPNIGFFEGTTSEYADMVKAGACGVLAGDPKAYVVFGGMAGVDRPFLDLCYQHGVAPYFDVMACHPYQWGAVFDYRWFFEKLTTCRRAMDDRGDPGKPMWLNELGWSTGDAAITEDVQARLLVQCYVSAIARRDLGVERVFWFCVKDWGGPGYGLYADDSRKKPAWYAYQTMARSLRGLKCIGTVAAGDAARAYAFGAEGQADAVLVLWSADAGEHPADLALAKEPTRAWDIAGKDIPAGQWGGGRLKLTARPAPVYIQAPLSALGGLAEVRPLRIGLPDPGRRSPVWVSLYPQRGCEMPWLCRGRMTTLAGRLFNASGRQAAGTVTVALARPDGRALGKASAPVAAAPGTDAVFSLSVPCPGGAPDEAVLRVTPNLAGARADALTIAALCGDGPTISFLANSHIERQMYLQPDPDCGCSESVRFGKRWVYRLPVALDGAARVRMRVGAHMAQAWSVAWSQDGKAWQDLMHGASALDWRQATIPALKAGALYLKCEGSNQQVGEVRVTLAPAAP